MPRVSARRSAKRFAMPAASAFCESTTSAAPSRKRKMPGFGSTCAGWGINGGACAAAGRAGGGVVQLASAAKSSVESERLLIESPNRILIIRTEAYLRHSGEGRNPALPRGENLDPGLRRDDANRCEYAG